ncbi:hypothetical protein DFH27DRAFT_609684 [Peziza echinospora]|nr:hypothetical protein DFH27DRAFT_609684 [Peziza echinospora]
MTLRVQADDARNVTPEEDDEVWGITLNAEPPLPATNEDETSRIEEAHHASEVSPADCHPAISDNFSHNPTRHDEHCTTLTVFSIPHDYPAYLHDTNKEKPKLDKKY